MSKKVVLSLASATIILAIFIILSINIMKYCLNINKIKNPILNQIIERKALHVGMLRSLTTLYIDYRNPNQVGGFEYTLLKNFADSLEVKLKITFANNMAELIEKSKEQKVDIIAAELKGSSIDLNHFKATIPFYHSTQQLVYRKGSVKPYSFSDISGNLTIAANSLQSHILQNIKTDFSELVWNESSTLNQEELLKLVDNQEIDYTIASNNTIAIMQRIHPLLTVAFDLKTELPKSWYVEESEDDSLLKRINQFIQTSIDDGTIEKLEYDYFSYMNDFDYVDTREFIRAINEKLPAYQSLFEKYSKIHKLDWKFIAAMSYQESHWNPKAISSTGVRGMMMLTQTTAKSLGITNRLDPEQSIKGGIQYLKQLINRLPDTILKEEQVWFALAAYNMGMGHLWDARTLAKTLNKNPDDWQDVRQVLPLLTEEEYYKDLKYGFARGHQAVHFVDSIQQYYISLVGYFLEKEHRKKEDEN